MTAPKPPWPTSLCVLPAVKEYQDPLDRRFHAEPTACPDCGPHLWLEYQGQRWESNALAKAGELLKAGKILAIKGLGGFHLACDAGCEAAVELLRRRKGRKDKPFAVMVRDLNVAEEIGELTEADRQLLTSPSSPIVLVRRKNCRRPGLRIGPRKQIPGPHAAVYAPAPVAFAVLPASIGHDQR